METPAPIIQTIKDFKILSDKNKDFQLTIKLDESNLEITIVSINEIPNLSYKNDYSLEQLFQINKYFKLCQTIGEAYNVIIDNLELKNYELKEFINNLSLIIITNDKLCGNYIFEIPLCKKTEREDINEIYSLIKEVKLENSKLLKEKKEIEENLKNEIKSLKEELEKVKNENKVSNQNYENLKSLFEQYKNDFEKMKKFGFPSYLLNPKNNCGEYSVQFFQTPESYENSEKNWAHYIVLNHGNGNEYYQVVVRFPFWNGNVQIGHRENGCWKGWKNICESY